MITRDELIIDMMPFSRELIEWCKKYPDFTKALKIIYPEKFITLGAVVTSQSPNYPEDEVIGIYTYAYKLKTPIYKQDFVINKERHNKEFILYTRHQSPNSSKYIKDINDFYATYGKGGHYVKSHHLSFEELPEEIRPRAVEAIDLARRVQITGLRRLSQKHLKKVYRKVRVEKRGEWFYKQKLQAKQNK
ncbi:MAG: hypothetical protein A2868_03355 [Candidatus Levybacteria bacterium RIFCSPHIGHO2_01_FULL_40_15b]|nr:MAG: hypothetical protein A2868_03355 [Candidatus Levybacteria bacterium RIFCSPHIGHO2_01_FULL_40_15b]